MLFDGINSHARCPVQAASVASLFVRRPRLLTDPDEIAASDAFRAALDACGKSQSAVADEIGDGVSQGTIWQWANRRLAIPAARAPDAARAVNAYPEAISVAFREEARRHGNLQVREPGPRASQSVGFPLSTITDAMLVVRAYLEDKGLPLSMAVSDPWLVKIAIDLVADASVRLDVTNVIAFKKRFTDRLSEEGHADQGERTAEAG